MNQPTDKSQSYSMARLASFVVLLIIICVIGAMFYKVMKTFILPLFLAALIVVIVKPCHVWLLKQCRGRRRVAAFLTTSLVGLLILGPFAMFAFFAVDEGRQLLRGDWELETQLTGLREKFRLDIPEKTQLDQVRFDYDAFVTTTDDGTFQPDYQTGEVAKLGKSLEELDEQIQASCNEAIYHLPADELESVEPFVTEEAWNWIRKSSASRRSDVLSAGPAENEASVANARTLRKELLRGIESREVLNDAREVIAEFIQLDAADGIPPERHHELATASMASRNLYDSLRVQMLGGMPWSLIREVAHPNKQQFAVWKDRAGGYLTRMTLSLSGRTPALLGRTLLVISIMLLAIYYFLIDGPEMIKTLMRLSPLDDRYETELLAEFDNVSRAVVLATLLSALAQGLLAGIGYFFVGMPSVFLLTLLTGVLAMVPFVGAAAVWAPAAIYLGFVMDPPRVGAAIALAAYGFLVVSMADNLIKPYVLHGQSNLHPLLALLSVLGGVQALGAVGILVGPMVVAFLQALLNILRKEMMGTKTAS